ncbi:hypothetical protein ACFPVX_16455 [Cohnella faecalis]|uniref:Uncharacterized protein n=1 Tax=Cohnella faecalis TaxID=2315694 RepID=A0A398CJ22_9BACL|nr:hypothetical protein [Cohnella faecalis]RIE02743.1 hypothetical protein D3H35_19050 [Cohnella faecalis]
MFEAEWERFVQEQKRTAGPLRLEQLNKNKSGEKKLFEIVVWPIFKSFDGWAMEHEVVMPSGVRIYLDAFYMPFEWSLECEGFAVHAETITRDRFDFEKERIRTMAIYGYRFMPFSRDQLDKKPDACRRFMYEMLGRFSSSASTGYYDLCIYEREIIRYAIRLGRPIRMKDARACLQTSEEHCRSILKKMVSKGLIRPVDETKQRCHAYVLEPLGRHALFG